MMKHMHIAIVLIAASAASLPMAAEAEKFQGLRASSSAAQRRTGRTEQATQRILVGDGDEQEEKCCRKYDKVCKPKCTFDCLVWCDNDPKVCCKYLKVCDDGSEDDGSERDAEAKCLYKCVEPCDGEDVETSKALQTNESTMAEEGSGQHSINANEEKEVIMLRNGHHGSVSRPVTWLRPTEATNIGRRRGLISIMFHLFVFLLFSFLQNKSGSYTGSSGDGSWASESVRFKSVGFGKLVHLLYPSCKILIFSLFLFNLLATD